MTQFHHIRVLGVFLCLTWGTYCDALASAGASVNKKAVIVGGGPVGLATALTLSNPPHSYDVTVLEQASVEQYDPTKAYLYNVNPRGQKWMTENFPGALEKLKIRGSGGSMSRITIVPADPSQPIPERKNVGRYDTKKNNPNNAATATETKTDSDNTATAEKNPSYWIPRHSMICLLEDEIEEQQAVRSSNGQVGEIQIMKARKFSTMQPRDGKIHVFAENLENGKFEEYSGTLVVAADGFNSAVRDCLADKSKDTWLQNKAEKFRVKKWVSPASGLRMKVIQMPPGFSLPDSDGSMKKTENEFTYAIRGKYNGFTNYLSLGLLPVKDASMVRPANVITRPNHEVWKIKSGPTAKKWFTDAFPRFNWDDYVDDNEWERFAKATGTTFPNCQYSPGLQVCAPDKKSGVALVGDAAHAFPPDIGQGINAGLCDVVAFDRALRGKNIVSGEEEEKPDSLGTALENYERVQVPEISSLIKIARWGFPYQYRQALFRDRVGRLLLTTNIAFRLLLNKLSFGVIPASAIVLLQNPNLTYRQVMRRADMTTAGLSAVALTVGWRLFGSGVKKLVGLS